jgi:hypothetical protein
MDMYHSRGVGPPHDDDNSSTGNRDSKDKGRGSYKCGRVSLIMRFLLDENFEIINRFHSLL